MDPTKTTIPRAPGAASTQLPAILALPFELKAQIAIRIRDVHTWCSYAQVCSDFASLVRHPVYVDAWSDTFVDEHCARLADIDGAEVRAARIYTLARQLGSRMKPAHLHRMMMLLTPKNEAERNADEKIEASHSWAMASYPPVDGMLMAEEEFKLLTVCRCATVGAALCSGQIAGLEDAVTESAIRYAKAGWSAHSAPLGPLSLMPVTAIPPSHAALVGDAALGIWLPAKDGTYPIDGISLRRLAADMLGLCASLPVAAKLGLMEQIFGTSAANSVFMPESGDLPPDAAAWEVVQVQSQRMFYRFVIRALHQSARYPETLTLPQADRFFCMLASVVLDMEANGIPVSEKHLQFARMLPALPWRSSSAAGLVWLQTALSNHEHVPPASDEEEEEEEERDSEPLTFHQYKMLLPQGMFTDEELAYLLKSIADGTFSWDALGAVDAPFSAAPHPSADTH